MTTHQVTGLIGPMLDAAVAKAEGFPSFWIDLGDDSREPACVLGHARAQDARFDWCPSTAWEQGGPIIERERITVQAMDYAHRNDWQASTDAFVTTAHAGDTPLIAAMRAYVASKLGETVELP